MIKRLLTLTFFAATLGAGVAFPLAASAQVSLNIGINVPPPAPVYEAVPSPRPGYIWQPGYWAWDDRGHKHRWREGHWVVERPGYVYDAPRWVEGSRGWILLPERWSYRDGGRDRDWDDRDRGRGPGGYHCPPGHAKKGEC